MFSDLFGPVDLHELVIGCDFHSLTEVTMWAIHHGMNKPIGDLIPGEKFKDERLMPSVVVKCPVSNK